MPGIGNLGSDAPLSRGKKIAMVVGAILALAGGLAAAFLAPSRGAGGDDAPPASALLAYGEADALFAARGRELGALWRSFESTQFFKEVVATPAGLAGSALLAGLSRMAPETLRDLAPVWRTLLDGDAAFFLYGRDQNTALEVTALSRLGSAPPLVGATETGEQHQGVAIRTLAPTPGRTLFVAVRGTSLFVATHKKRLQTMLDRDVATAADAVRLDAQPGVASLLTDLPARDRLMVVADLPALVRHVRRRGVLGDAAAASDPAASGSAASDLAGRTFFVLSADPRVGGAVLSGNAVFASLPSWLSTLVSYLGNASPLRTSSIAPTGAVAVVGAHLDPGKLAARFAAPTPPADMLSGAHGFLADALKGEAAAHVANFTGEAVLGMLPGTLLPSPFAAAAVKDDAKARITVNALANFVPGGLSELAKLVSTVSEQDVEGVKLTAREIPVLGGFGYGVHGGWLFGGGLSAAQGVARAMAGKGGLVLHPLANEVFASPAQGLLWAEVAPLTRFVQRLGTILGPAASALSTLGRLTEVLRDAGLTVRVDPQTPQGHRFALRAFVRYADLAPPQ